MSASEHYDENSNEAVLEAIVDLTKLVSKIDIKVSNLDTQIFNKDTGVFKTICKHDVSLYGNGKPGALSDIIAMKSDIKNIRDEAKFTWRQLVLVGALVLVFGSILAFVMTSSIFVPHAQASTN